MRPVKKILCAVDFLDCSAQVAQAAATTAGAFGAEILLLHVVSEPPGGVSDYRPTEEFLETLEKEHRESAATNMAEVIAKHFQGFQVETEVVMGSPAEQILDQADKSGADLIVMGTLGRRGLARLFFGSVAEEVVKSSPVPVLTIRPQEC